MSQDTQRREEALEVAFELFLRFGYRKTSMDEVARAVGLSRQGLYLWFPNKKSLFAEVFEHHMRAKMSAIEALLLEEQGALSRRITSAFVTFFGAAVGARSEAMDELLGAGLSMLGDRLLEYEEDFQRILTDALEPFADEQHTPQDLAQMLYATSTGWKYRAADLEVYRQGVHKAVTLVCRGEGRP